MAEPFGLERNFTLIHFGLIAGKRGTTSNARERWRSLAEYNSAIQQSAAKPPPSPED